FPGRRQSAAVRAPPRCRMSRPRWSWDLRRECVRGSRPCSARPVSSAAGLRPIRALCYRLAGKQRDNEMETFDLVVRGGTVVTATDTAEADVGIRGETVAAIGRGLD